MSCYHPIKAFRTADGVVFAERTGRDIVGDIELPCGQCIGCRLRRAEEWQLRVMHEAQLYGTNCCFVTLTYGRDCVPSGGSLSHRDFQLFLKRVRRKFGPVRFFMCGEYGPLNLRPHYHACLFGVDFRSDRVVAGKSGSGAVFYDSSQLRDLWSFGHVSVQDLTRETAGYCARYIMDKLTGELGDTVYGERVAPYCRMSLKPGIGGRWYERFGRDVFPHDFCVSDGVERRVPRYYDRMARRDVGVDMDSVEFARYKRALESAPDNTDERRSVREFVQLAKVQSLKRGL